MYTPILINHVKEVISNNTAEDAAKLLNVTPQWIHKLEKRFGVKALRKPVANEKRIEIEESLISGMRQKDVVKKYGVSRQYVSKISKNLGI